MPISLRVSLTAFSIAMPLLALAACGDDSASGTGGGSSSTGAAGTAGTASTAASSPTSGPGSSGAEGSGGDGPSGPSGPGAGGGDPTSTGPGGPGSGGSGAGGFDPPPPPPPVCDPPAELAPTDGAAVVGTGTAESCDEAALDAALATGSPITFDCGGPATITITETKVITADTVIDGDDEITIQGSGAARLFEIDTGGNFEATSPVFTVQRITLSGGRASGTAIPLGTDLDGGGGAVFFVGGRFVAIDTLFVDDAAALEGPDVAGGAIYGIGGGGVTVVGSRFTGNRAANGGAIGVLGGSLTIVNSTFNDNEATGFGANYVDENGQQQGRGGNGGAAVMDGQGRTLTICGSSFLGNRGRAFGGALFRTSYESEPTTISLSTFDDNEVIEPADPDESSGAGAIYLQGSFVELQSSTISNNRARGNAGVWIMGHGPGAPGRANLVNVSIVDNVVFTQDPFTDTGLGGGLTIGDGTSGLVLNCTIAGNSSQFAAGISRVSPLEVRNTIIANTALNLYTPLNCTGSSFDTPPAAGDHNMQYAWVDGVAVPTGPQSDMDCTPGITRADPLLDALGDHGGVTATRAPTAGSPALGGGADCPTVDQRGEPRDTGTCTIGAVEVTP